MKAQIFRYCFCVPSLVCLLILCSFEGATLWVVCRNHPKLKFGGIAMFRRPFNSIIAVKKFRLGNIHRTIWCNFSVKLSIEPLFCKGGQNCMRSCLAYHAFWSNAGTKSCYTWFALHAPQRGLFEFWGVI